MARSLSLSRARAGGGGGGGGLSFVPRAAHEALVAANPRFTVHARGLAVPALELLAVLV
jgi:hypothetical protein